MIILFIENRYKTYFFAEVANELSNRGHEIHWLVQNKIFKKENKTFHNHVIPYSNKRKNETWEKNQEIENIISGDRQINFFKLKDKSHFYYYHSYINRKILEIQPAVVFGESTAFHELLTISICKKLEIPYFHPSSCRYPKNRFSFYVNDTLVPYNGSNESLHEESAIEIIDSISKRTAKPDYMKKVKKNRVKNGKDKITILKGYFFGEKFNTPNPFVKYDLEKQKKLNIEAWDKIAIKELSNEKLNIVYPLQMQPEANIDVWGRKYRDQLQLIKDIYYNLKEEYNFYIKPNPKSKYELSEELIEFVSNNERIAGIHHSTSMDTIFPNVDLFITVTGTIAIECILSNKPVLNLVETLNNRSRNCVYLNNLSQITTWIKKVEDNSFPKIELEEKIKFINHLNKTSFKGVISDPFHDPNCVNKENIRDVVKAFNQLLEKYE
ncbi:hypothetical protein J8L88_01025 [Aquimarina sp. MMG015]|uniref:hypothetical protein n=1 Tax=Aquimarina sp. MMG015 TaxID=2822689 RepID=UPI001B3A428D|nr:hypothetical protein [Aquimarina sp. MMG015]MBQ4801414.1 hypothetical protein [Aquimarina sp. MMG015]